MNRGQLSQPADKMCIRDRQKVNDIIKYDIDVLVVGSDWRGKFDYLKNYCDVVLSLIHI